MKSLNNKILIIDDEPDITELLKDILEDENYHVVTCANAEEGNTYYQKGDIDLVLLDIWMPEKDGISLLSDWHEKGLKCSVVMMSGHGTIETAVQATKFGAFDFIEKPVSVAKLLITVSNALSVQSLSKTNEKLIKQLNPLVKIIGQSKEITELKSTLDNLKDISLPVLFFGANGVGKETCARFLHQQSQRFDQPFIIFNADNNNADAQIQALLGNKNELGLIQLAESGTFYVSEIVDLHVETQIKLASIIKQKQFNKEDDLIDVFAQFSFATRFSIEESLNNGQLHESLYAAINSLTIKVPKLSDYREDVPELLKHFSYYFVDSEKLPLRMFSMPAQNYLRQYDWPGNVLELKNYVQRVLAMGTADEVGLEEAKSFLDNEFLADDPKEYYIPLHLPLREAREAFEKAYFIKQLSASEGNVAKLAERAGMERTNLYRKLKSLDIQYKN